MPRRLWLRNVPRLNRCFTQLMTCKHSGSQDSCIQLPTTMMTLTMQVASLLILGIPVACIAWTVTHEEVFRESRQYCQKECSQARSLARRKFFYLFTCEYCFSHYVAAAMLVVTRYRLLFPDWRGYLVAFFALVWIANQYMSIYNRLRLDIKHEQVEIKAEEVNVGKRKESIEPAKSSGEN